MKKVLAMSLITMIVMSMGSCGVSSDSSSSQDVSSNAETESNSPYTVEHFFAKNESLYKLNSRNLMKSMLGSDGTIIGCRHDLTKFFLDHIPGRIQAFNRCFHVFIDFDIASFI